MPEIVKPDARQFGRRQEPIPGMADRIGLLRHDLPSGKALGSYETWAEWCRDPLLALGCRDPVDRIAEIKEADPRRRALVAVLDAWWEKHGDTTLKSKDLDPVVIELIDLRASRKADGSLQYNRQRVAIPPTLAHGLAAIFSNKRKTTHSLGRSHTTGCNVMASNRPWSRPNNRQAPSGQCPLSGAKRTFPLLGSMSVIDPKRTFTDQFRCDAQ